MPPLGRRPAAAGRVFVPIGITSLSRLRAENSPTLIDARRYFHESGSITKHHPERPCNFHSFSHSCRRDPTLLCILNDSPFFCLNRLARRQWSLRQRIPSSLRAARWTVPVVADILPEAPFSFLRIVSRR